MENRIEREKLLKEALTQIMICGRKNSKSLAWEHARNAVELTCKAGLGEQINDWANTGTGDPNDVLGKDRYPQVETLRGIINCALEPDLVVITKYSGAVEWLRRHGHRIDQVIDGMATPDQIKNRDVVGKLPWALAALANSVSIIEIPNRPEYMLGTALSADEMEDYGAYMRRYRITALNLM